MDPARALETLRASAPAHGAERRLAVGPWVVRFAGLDARTARRLDRRWGPFVSERGAGAATLDVALVDSRLDAWLERWAPGDRYRVEGASVEGVPVALSYHFALAADRPGAWRAHVVEGADEPGERLLDNVARILIARLAAESGGLALHGAGVLRGGRAWVFAGPSRAGKTTAVSHSGPGRGLGDDFAVLLPGGAGWLAAAVPFDNAETVPPDALTGTFPLAGVLRLHKSSEDRVERPSAPAAAASLLACAAFPWAIPDLGDVTTAAATRLVGDGLFGHLHFRPSSEFWRLLE